jgi:ABC-2 type transport system permease protein
MGAYWALFKTEFQQYLQYRVSAVAGAVTNIAFGFFRLFLLTAFYRASDAAQPMALPDLYSYLWFGQVLFSVMPITGLFGPDAEEIRSGAVAYRLTRPVSLYGFYFARVLGQKVTALCTRSAIQVAILFLVLPLAGLGRYGMRPPDMAMLPYLVPSLLLALLLSAAMHSFIYMTGFWTISTRGSTSISYAVISLFSGLLVPLVFFPPVLRTVADILPFRGIYDTTAMIYNGSSSIAEALGGLAHQAAWFAGLVLLGLTLARRGTRRLEIAGG